MAFEEIVKDYGPPTDLPPFVTFAPKVNGALLRVSKRASELLSDPRAVRFAWDPDAAMLLISASAPDTPNAFPLARRTRETCIATVLHRIGVHITETTRVPVIPDGQFSILADLSPYTTKGTP